MQSGVGMSPHWREQVDRREDKGVLKEAEDELMGAIEKLVEELGALAKAMSSNSWVRSSRSRSYSPRKQMVSSEEERRVLHFTNTERARYGLGALRLNGRLTAAAKSHTMDQAFRKKAMSHKGSDGSRPSRRVERKGYRYRFVAENVAHGHVNAEQVVEAWMNSSGHRRNILSRDAVDMGVYVTRGFDGKLFWTQVFGDTM